MLTKYGRHPEKNLKSGSEPNEDRIYLWEIQEK